MSGFATPFLRVVMFAVSRDAAAARPCLFAQVEGRDAGAPADVSEDEDDCECTELRLVPADASRLDVIFRALCDAAALNPDPETEGGDEDGELFFDEDGGAQDEAMVARLESMLHVDASRFEDAE